MAGKSPTRVHVVISGDLFDRLADYHRAAGIAGSLADTVRELTWAGLSAPQLSSALVAATRKRAYVQVRNDTIRRFRLALWQTLVEFDRSLATFNDEELDRHFDRDPVDREPAA